MLIDRNQFTPWSAFTGGGIIGSAVALLIRFNGRIAGISGIVGGLFTAGRGDVAWRIAFVSGLVAEPWSGIFFRSCRPSGLTPAMPYWQWRDDCRNRHVVWFGLQGAQNAVK